MVYVTRNIGNYLDNELPQLLPQLPPITIENGKASVTVKEPYFITGSDGGKLIVIDTSGKHFKTPKEAEAKMLISADEIIAQFDENDAVPIVEFRMLEGNRVIDAAFIENMAELFRGKGMAALSLTIFTLLYLFRLVIALLYALAGMIFTRQMNLDMGFGALYQIALVAEGTSLLGISFLAFLLAFLGIAVPGSTAGALMAIFYMWFGVKSNREWIAESLPPLKERF